MTSQHGESDVTNPCMLVHTWEAPALVATCAIGRFSSAGTTSCAIGQQGGMSMMEASQNTVDLTEQLVMNDRLDHLVTIPLPGLGTDYLLSLCSDMTVSILCPQEEGPPLVAAHTKVPLDTAHTTQRPMRLTGAVVSQPVVMCHPSASTAGGQPGGKEDMHVYIAFAVDPLVIQILEICLQDIANTWDTNSSRTCPNADLRLSWGEAIIPKSLQMPQLLSFDPTPHVTIIEALAFVPPPARPTNPMNHKDYDIGVAACTRVLALLVRRQIKGEERFDVVTMGVALTVMQAGTHRSSLTQPLEAVQIQRTYECEDGPWSLQNLHPTTTLLIPVPEPPWHTNAPSQHAPDKTLPGDVSGRSPPGLLVVSQVDATLMSVSEQEYGQTVRCHSEQPYVVADVHMELHGPPASGVSLGNGMFLIGDRSGVISLARVSDMEHNWVKPCCITASQANDTKPSTNEYTPVGGSINTLALLPCSHVPTLAAMVGLVIVGSSSGVSCVLGLPEAVLKEVLADGLPPLLHPVLPLLVDCLVDSAAPIHDCIALPTPSGSHEDSLLVACGNEFLPSLRSAHLAAALVPSSSIPGPIPLDAKLFSFTNVSSPNNSGSVDGACERACAVEWVAITSSVEQSTRVLQSFPDGEYEEVATGLQLNEMSLCIAHVGAGFLLQVTGHKAVIVNMVSGQVVAEHSLKAASLASSGSGYIAVAEADEVSVLIATGTSTGVDGTAPGLSKSASSDLSGDVTALEVCCWPEYRQIDGSSLERLVLVAAGVWASHSINLMTADSLNEVAVLSNLPMTPTAFQPLSHEHKRALVIGGLDGTVAIAHLTPSPSSHHRVYTLIVLRTVTVGTTRVSLVPFHSETDVKVLCIAGACALVSIRNNATTRVDGETPLAAREDTAPSVTLARVMPPKSDVVTSAASVTSESAVWTTRSGLLSTGHLDPELRIRWTKHDAGGIPERLTHCPASHSVACHLVDPRTGQSSLRLLHDKQIVPVLDMPFQDGHEVISLSTALLPTLESAEPFRSQHQPQELSDGTVLTGHAAGIDLVAREYVCVSSTLLVRQSQHDAVCTVPLLSIMQIEVHPIPDSTSARYALSLLGLLQLPAPCHACVSIVPKIILPETPEKLKDSFPDAPKKPSHAKPIPLLVIGTNCGITLIEVRVDPDLHLATAALDQAAQGIAHAEDLDLSHHTSEQGHLVSLADQLRATFLTVTSDVHTSDPDRRVHDITDSDRSDDPYLGWCPDLQASGLDLSKNWRQRVSVKKHCTAATFGNGCVTSIKSLGSRIYAADLLGSVTMYDVHWSHSRAHASLIPIAVDRSSTWAHSFLPLPGSRLLTASHPFSIMLHAERGDPPPPLAAGGPHARIRARASATGQATGEITGFMARPLLPQPELQSPELPGAVAFSDVASVLSLRLDRACNVRQAVTKLVKMRLGPCLPGKPECVAFVTAGGGLGCIRVLDGSCGDVALSLMHKIQEVEALREGQRGCGSVHKHRDTWPLILSTAREIPLEDMSATFCERNRKVVEAVDVALLQRWSRVVRDEGEGIIVEAEYPEKRSFNGLVLAPDEVSLLRTVCDVDGLLLSGM